MNYFPKLPSPLILNFLFFFLVIISSQIITGQNQIVTDSINNTEIDKLYKEDQFYIGITYLLLNDLHKDMSQHGFSTGLSFGYIKDIPLNKDRNFGLGIGIGLSSNSLNQNLKIYCDVIFSTQFVYTVYPFGTKNLVFRCKKTPYCSATGVYC